MRLQKKRYIDPPLIHDSDSWGQKENLVASNYQILTSSIVRQRQNPNWWQQKKFLNIEEFVHELIEAQISPGSRQDYAVPHNWHKKKKMGWRASYSHLPSQQCLSRLTRACKPLLFHDSMDALQYITTGGFKWRALPYTSHCKNEGE